MNNDLISREALKKEFCKDIMGGLNWERIIDKAPTFEQKGDWIFCEGVTTQGSLKCSVCEWLDFRKAYFNYCPNCGAKMKNDTKQ